MFSDNQSIGQFWREKEEELHSSLVIATAAEYLAGFEKINAPVSGLLYIMENGIYFENFPSTNWMDSILNKNTKFTPIKLEFKKEDITTVVCFPGQESKKSLSFPAKVLNFFSSPPRQFIIHYKHEGTEQSVYFDSMKNPQLLCDAFYKNLQKNSAKIIKN